MEQFLHDVKAYAAACGVLPTTIVQRATPSGGGTWDRWASGKSSPTLHTADRIRAYMAANPPPELAEAG